ncbi:TraR/DksA family transcriptional regulator [Nonomuraea zeae]|uniref:TraR/DksA family transcriptional regulator n=1 Tax=Nonomuraea zeae TaxID=1642303 RepID=A0A5S4H2W7_9ACTN|nr:TraR/DksA family transcriptional regulator [Nonomuraea zeae]TMR39598.1 TraR/DksA family transcriptional regulator [Nonomuraea zeae]
MDDTTARERLEDMLAELDRAIGVLQGDPVAIREHSAAAAGDNLTDADRAQAMLNVATAQRRAVIEALKRIDEGVYGRCVDCGRPVYEARLEARPEAPRCVHCQGKQERRHISADLEPDVRPSSPTSEPSGTSTQRALEGWANQLAILAARDHAGPPMAHLARSPIEAGLRVALGLHAATGEAAGLPVTIYLEDGRRSSDVERAVRDLLAAHGLEDWGWSSPIHGSWLRTLFTRGKQVASSEVTKELLDEVRRAIELRTLHEPQAAVDEKKCAAATGLIAALKDERRAAVMIGSILILKDVELLIVRELTQRELCYLERNPELLKCPGQLLDDLQSLPEEPATAVRHGASQPELSGHFGGVGGADDD